MARSNYTLLACGCSASTPPATIQATERTIGQQAVKRAQLMATCYSTWWMELAVGETLDPLELSLSGAKVSRHFRSREQTLQGAKVRGSESSTIRVLSAKTYTICETKHDRINVATFRFCIKINSLGRPSTAGVHS